MVFMTSLKSKKAKKCIVCGANLHSWDECAELWFNGHRIWICQNQRCHAKYVEKMRDENIDKNKLI